MSLETLDRISALNLEAGGGRAGPGPRVLSWASAQPGNGRSRTPGAPRRAPLGPEPPALTCTGVREPLAPRPVPARSAGCSPALRTRGGSGGGDAGSARREATGAKRRGKRSSSAGSPSLGLGAAARPARSPRRVPARAARGWRPALPARRPAGRAAAPAQCESCALSLSHHHLSNGSCPAICRGLWKF